jgi:hypothetical protein
MTKNKNIYIFIVAILLQTTTPNNTPEKSENTLKKIIYECGIITNQETMIGGLVNQLEYDEYKDQEENHEHTPACTNHPEIHVIKKLTKYKSIGRSGELARIVAYHFRKNITNAISDLNNYHHIFALGKVDDNDMVNPVGGCLTKMIAIGNYIKKNTIDITQCSIIIPEENHYEAMILKTYIEKYFLLKFPNIYSAHQVSDALEILSQSIKNNNQNKNNQDKNILKYIENYNKNTYEDIFFSDYNYFIEKIFFNLLNDFVLKKRFEELTPIEYENTKIVLQKVIINNFRRYSFSKYFLEKIADHSPLIKTTSWYNNFLSHSKNITNDYEKCLYDNIIKPAYKNNKIYENKKRHYNLYNLFT